MNKSFRDNLLFLIVAHVCWLAEPAIVHAQNESYHPINFTQPLNVGRGSLSPIGQEAIYLSDDERCKMLVELMGWRKEECRVVDEMALNMGPIDTLMVNIPVSDGYVSLDDFTGTDAGSEVDAITDTYKTSIKKQSTALGINIEFLGWRLYPQVDRAKSIMYFANMLQWGGDKVLNISIVMFDRYGYVPMKVIPVNAELDGDQLKAVVDQAVATYKANSGNSYAQFENGDTVAAYGALSVFAGILGVKYGKAAGVGIIAVALLLLKKAWFVLLLPLVWLGRLFRKKPPATPSA